ncbi:MAG: hypothetical protein OXT67_10705 [Zetaproteobacteria bacterium]|nr:hypothetical protein [Zetaproteobacteria bacterium]
MNQSCPGRKGVPVVLAMLAFSGPLHAGPTSKGRQAFYFERQRADAVGVFYQLADSLLQLLSDLAPGERPSSPQEYPSVVRDFAAHMIQSTAMIVDASAGPSLVAETKDRPVVCDFDESRESMATVCSGNHKVIPLLHRLLKVGHSKQGLNFSYEDMDTSVPHLEEMIRLYFLFSTEFSPEDMSVPEVLPPLFEYHVAGALGLRDTPYQISAILEPNAYQRMLEGFRKMMHKAQQKMYTKFVREGTSMADIMRQRGEYMQMRARTDFVDIQASDFRPESRHLFKVEDMLVSSEEWKRLRQRGRLRDKLNNKQQAPTFYEERNDPNFVHEFCTSSAQLLFFARWILERHPEERDVLEALQSGHVEDMQDILDRKPYFGTFLRSPEYRDYKVKAEQMQFELQQRIADLAAAELDLLDAAESKKKKKSKGKKKKKAKGRDVMSTPSVVEEVPVDPKAGVDVAAITPARTAPVLEVDPFAYTDAADQPLSWSALAQQLHSGEGHSYMTGRLLRWNAPLSHARIRRFVDYTRDGSQVWSYQHTTVAGLEEAWLAHQAIHFLPLFEDEGLAEQYFVSTSNMHARRKSFLGAATMRLSSGGQVLHGFVEFTAVDRQDGRAWIHAAFRTLGYKSMPDRDAIIQDSLRNTEGECAFSAKQPYFTVERDRQGTIVLNFGHATCGGGQLFLFPNTNI